MKPFFAESAKYTFTQHISCFKKLEALHLIRLRHPAGNAINQTDLVAFLAYASMRVSPQRLRCLSVGHRYCMLEATWQIASSKEQAARSNMKLAQAKASNEGPEDALLPQHGNDSDSWDEIGLDYIKVSQTRVLYSAVRGKLTKILYHKSKAEESPLRWHDVMRASDGDALALHKEIKTGRITH